MFAAGTEQERSGRAEWSGLFWVFFPPVRGFCGVAAESVRETDFRVCRRANPTGGGVVPDNEIGVPFVFRGGRASGYRKGAMAHPPSAQRARRLFIGLRLPLAIGTPLAADVRRALAPAGEPPRGLRLVAACDLHLTLCFLGAVAEAHLERLGRVLEEELGALTGPELVVRGAGGFPELGAPRVLWCGVEEVDAGGRLAGLHEGAWDAARSVGWRPSRAERGQPFRPHLTVARVRRDRLAAGVSFVGFGGIGFEARWRPSAVLLIESRPDRPEERYPTLHTVPLVFPPGSGDSAAQTP